jgi:hypothetical protein
MEVMDFPPTKQSSFRRLGSVTLQEMVIRAWMVAFFIFSSICLYNTIHNTLVIIFVGSKFDSPGDWLPLFGDIRNATFIGDFWGEC